MSHTPGPWLIDRDPRPNMEWNNHIVSAEQPHMTVCFMTHSGTDDNSECEANAHLIAAAPDMVEVLADALSAIESLPEDALGSVPDTDTQGWFIRDELAHRIGNVLAKAKAEQ